MIITAIEQQKKNPDRFSIFVDGAYEFSLSTDGLLDAGVAKGDELEPTRLEELKKQSSDGLLLSRAYEKCLRRPHSSREIRDYLRRKGAEGELIDHIIAKCQSAGVLSDEQFANAWVQHRRTQGKSKRYIMNELRSKGIEQSLAEAALEQSNSDDEASLQAVIAKKSARYPDEKKLIAYLQRQGFRYDDIRRELDSDEA